MATHEQKGDRPDVPEVLADLRAAVVAAIDQIDSLLSGGERVVHDHDCDQEATD